LRKPDALLDEYYRVRGWNENGVPARDKLKELGLEEIIGDIAQVY
jgi:aldehyde:ferredoxin oxidoreductase